MPPKKQKKSGNRARSEGKPINVGTMQFWRELAGELLPEVDDELQIGELAVLLQQQSLAISQEWKGISKICDKNEDSCISFGTGFSIDRRTTPSEVAVKLSYSEKHNVTFKVTVPDPNQIELPGLNESEVTRSEGPGKEPAGDGAGDGGSDGGAGG